MEKRIRGYFERVYRFTNSDSIEIERVHTGEYGAPRRKRQKKRKATPEEVEKQNFTNRKNRMRRYLKENFKAEEDLWITFTYQKGTKTDIEAVKRDFKKFIRWLKYQYKIRGYPLMWIATFHVGKLGAGHFHMVINRIPDYDKIIKKTWSRIESSGHINIELLYEQGEFEQLASYIVKVVQPDPKEGSLKASEYSHSRNLVLPIPKEREIKTKCMLDEPKPYKGYYIEWATLVAGRNPITGHRYQHFTMKKIRGPGNG